MSSNTFKWENMWTGSLLHNIPTAEPNKMHPVSSNENKVCPAFLWIILEEVYIPQICTPVQYSSKRLL